jgi:hypothetical protein
VLESVETNYVSMGEVYQFEEDLVGTIARQLLHTENESLQLVLELRKKSISLFNNKVSKKADMLMNKSLYERGYFNRQQSNDEEGEPRYFSEKR